MLWTELGSSRMIGWSLNPQNCECNLIWKEDLYRCSQVKVRSLGSALIQYDWYTYKIRKFGHRFTQQGKCHVKTGVMLPQVKEIPETKREAWGRVFPGAFRGSRALPSTRFRTWDNFLLFRHCSLEALSHGRFGG